MVEQLDRVARPMATLKLAKVRIAVGGAAARAVRAITRCRPR